MGSVDWGDMTLAEALDRTVERFPDRPGIIFKGARITYAEMRRNIDTLAKALLKSGLQKGDKVAIMMQNCPEWVFVRDAVIRAGGWWVPINTRYKSSELEYILKNSDATHLFLTDQFLNIDLMGLLLSVCPELPLSEPGNLRLEKLPMLRTVVCLSEKSYKGVIRYKDFLETGRDYPDRELERAKGSIRPDDIANLNYTSGTTGFPKGVMTRHSQYLKAMAAMAERFGTTEEDRVLLPAPMFTNIGNLTGIIQSEMFGAPMVILEYFDTPQVLKAIKEERCSIFTGAPAMYTMIMEHPDFRSEDVKSMRTGIIGGAPFSPQLVQQIWDKIGMKIFSAYGMTENSAITTMSEVDDPPELIANTCGRLLFKDCQMKIVDPGTEEEVPPNKVGEIRTKGWLVTPGYYKMPEETAKSLDKNGWFKTGDLGTVDEKGYLRVTGRLKDMIISGGLNIDPVEIENLIATHDSVAMAQVVGIPDHRLGEVVMAFVKPKEGKRVTEEEIIEYCRGKIANYKVPKAVRLTEEFPLNPMGKIQKFKLREMAQGQG